MVMLKQFESDEPAAQNQHFHGYCEIPRSLI
jgi:hypothetical protein